MSTLNRAAMPPRSVSPTSFDIAAGADDARDVRVLRVHRKADLLLDAELHAAERQVAHMVGVHGVAFG